MLRPLVSASLVLALSCTLGAQVDRFAGWDRIVENGYRFDPDERQILGFSVRASTTARALMRDVEEAFAQGDARVAGRLLLRMQREFATDVIQVAGSGRSSARWVGAGEWAAYQLRHRIPAGTREILATAEQQQLLEHAVAWRDEELLRRLAVELEMLPEGARAASVLSELLREAGQDVDADVVLRRPSPSPAPEHGGELPAKPDMIWSRQLAIDRLAYESPKARNPFTLAPRVHEASFAPVRPVIDDGVVFVADSISVRAIDLVSGREHWAAPGPLEQLHDGSSAANDFPFWVYADTKRPRAINPYQVAQPAVTAEAVFATVQLGEEIYPLDSFDGFPINHPLPSRRLRAFDRHTGALLWTQGRPDLDEEAFENRFDPVGPPVVVGERVWVSGAVREGALSAWLASFDRRSGELRSRTLICTGQQELTMFNRPFHEHLVSPPLVRDGAVYVSTNLGVVGCVDASSGRTRWITRYEAVQREASVRMRSTLREVRWLNEAPWLVGDTLLVAPLDSEMLLGLDASTGRYRYELRSADSSSRVRPGPIRHQVVPLDADRYAVFTSTGVECREVRGGALLWPLRELAPDAYVVGRVVRDGDRLLVPCESELLVLSTEDGRVLASVDWPVFPGSRDLQVVAADGGVLVATDGAAVHGLMEAAGLSRRLRRESSGGELEATRQLAELSLLGGRFDDALEGFSELLAADLPPGLGERATSGAFEAALRRARQSERADDWVDALGRVRSPEQLIRHAEEILSALIDGARLDVVVGALDTLAEHAPRARLALAGEPAQPISVLRARYGLPLLAPSEQIELLQQLIAEDPDAQWGGVSVAERARRLQGELLATHGRALYADYEERARAQLDMGRSLDSVARLFPHAQAVAEGVRERLAAALAAGRADEVLRQTAGSTDGALLELRRQAAEALGETGYAALLRGELLAVPTPLGRLPASDLDGREFELHPLNGVSFREVTGRPDPEFAGHAPGFVSRSGELFVIDARRGELAWEGRALPEGRLTLVNDASFHREGELLVVRGGSTVEAMQLADGAQRWSVDLGGYGAKVVRSVAGGGLFLALRELSGDSMELVALGLRTGTEVFRLALPGVTDASMRRAGSSLALNVLGVLDPEREGRERRLLVVDLSAGAVQHEESLDGDVIMVGATHVPERVLFAGSDGAGSRLLGYDPQAGRWLWASDSNASFIGSSSLLEDGVGGYVLAVPTNLPGSRLRPHRVTPVDLDAGLGAPAQLPLLELVLGHELGAAPQLLLRDPDVAERFLLVDPRRGEALDELRFLPGELEGGVRVRHGADGFVLMAQTWDVPMQTSMWVVHGAGRQARYSVDVSELSRRTRPDMLLVDGALLVAAGNTVRVVRGEDPAR